MKLDELECICENINLVEYIKNREIIKSTMEYPDWLGDFTKEQLEELLKAGSKIWMYYYNNDFVCSMMFIPADSKSIFSLGLEDYNYKLVADYGPMMVNNKFLGNKLQYQMLKVLDSYSKEHNFKYASSTIHPDNIYSINNFINDNFIYIHTKEFKRGIRNIYFKEL